MQLLHIMQFEIPKNKIVSSQNIIYFSIGLSSNKLYWIEDQLADISTRFHTSASWLWPVELPATEYLINCIVRRQENQFQTISTLY